MLDGHCDSGPTYARAHRGPLWWRLRVWLAELLGEWACALEPADKSSTSWYSDDGLSVRHGWFVQIVRPGAAVGALRYSGWMLLKRCGYDPHDLRYGSPLRYYHDARKVA